MTAVNPASSSVDGESLWPRLAQLPLVVEGWEYDRLHAVLVDGFERITTPVRLVGAGADGLGEDVSVFREDGTALHEARPALPLEGEWTLAGFCEHLAALELWPKPPEYDLLVRCRRWAFESAELGVGRGRSSCSRRCFTLTHPTTGAERLQRGDPPGAPGSPLAPRPDATGFRWAASVDGDHHTRSLVEDRKRKDEIMGKTIMGAVVSLDGFMADDNDGVGPLFDWLGNGDVAWSFPGSDDELRTTQASADFMLDLYGDMAANVIGRRVFDMTNGWDGKPAAGEHVFVVTHRPPTDWEYADTAPFTFVDGVEQAIAAAKEFAGDRVVDVAAGQIGGQALRLGLIDQVVVNQVPVVFGSGRPFFATGGLAEPLRLENPTTIVRGDRVTHLVYDVCR